MKNNLEKLGYKIYDSFNNTNVHPSLSGHVDISLFFDGKNFISSKESYSYYKKIIEDADFKNKYLLIEGDSFLDKSYPSDVKYNLCYTGKYAIGNFNYIDERLISRLKEIDAKFININQGYANCSICCVDENSLITSDEGIFKTLKNTDLDILKIEEGNIELQGMNYGFIGGASAQLGNDNICFFGNINEHPNSNSIKKFIDKKGKKIMNLDSNKLKDYGGLIVF